MEFPVAIHKDPGSVYGVIVPDIPGCHSWGIDVENAIANVKRAIVLHVGMLVETGHPQQFVPSAVEFLRKQEGLADAVWAFVDVDLA